jgi:hypothetical protein
MSSSVDLVPSQADAFPAWNQVDSRGPVPDRNPIDAKTVTQALLEQMPKLGSYAAPGGAAQPSLARLMEMFVLLADHVMQIDETVASQFPRKMLANGEAEESQGLSPEAIQRYLASSDAEAARSKPEIERQLSNLGYRVWSVMKSMESLPRRYAKTRAPASIEEAPEMSAAGGFFRSDGKFRKYWEKYIELCGGRDGGTLVKTLSDLHGQILVEILQARSGGEIRASAAESKTANPARAAIDPVAPAEAAPSAAGALPSAG